MIPSSIAVSVFVGVMGIELSSAEAGEAGCVLLCPFSSFTSAPGGVCNSWLSPFTSLMGCCWMNMLCVDLPLIHSRFPPFLQWQRANQGERELAMLILGFWKNIVLKGALHHTSQLRLISCGLLHPESSALQGRRELSIFQANLENGGPWTYQGSTREIATDR